MKRSSHLMKMFSFFGIASKSLGLNVHSLCHHCQAFHNNVWNILIDYGDITC
jgi:hypothetical protein